MIGLIVARSKNNVIGKNGGMPWFIEGELSQFRELTTGNTVIMGRRTYEAIGHPLPNRRNIIISNSKKYSANNLITVGSLQEALSISEGDVYIGGGYGVYKAALPLVDVMYITEVDLIVTDGDTYFPEFDANVFDITIGETLGDEIKYTRTVYTRKQK